MGVNPAVFPEFWIVTAALFGALVGSFCNVCIYRLPRRCLSIVRPRSRCGSCLTPIAWYDNIPVVSWLLLGGRCRNCRAAIGWRYPAVELLTAGLFAAAAAVEFAEASSGGAAPSAGRMAVHCLLLAALVVAGFIDAEFRIIPDEITKPGIVAGLAATLLVPEIQRLPLGLAPLGFPSARAGSFAASAVGALWGWGMLKGVQILGLIFFRRKLQRLGAEDAMGLGDVKFMAMLGAFLGPHTVTLIFLLGCVFGSVVGLARLVFVRDHFIAFGPFLALAAGVMILAGGPVYDFMDWYLDLVAGG